MTPMTHNLTGLALGVGISAMLPPSMAGVFVAGCILGARAPDWLEVARFNRRTGQRTSLIPHRTLTHWPWTWLALLILAAISAAEPGVNKHTAVAVAGFAASGLLHIGADCMTSMGCPLGINPFGRRASLRLLKTGSAREVLVIIFAFVLASASWGMLRV